MTFPSTDDTSVRII